MSGENPAKLVMTSLSKKIAEKKKGTSVTHNFQTPPPEPIIPAKYQDCTIFDLDPLEISRQITLSDFGKYRLIKSEELIEKRWIGGEKRLHAPNVIEMIENFNKLSFLVVSSILDFSEVRKRAHAIERWIEIACHLKGMNNYSGFVSVVSGLLNSSIHRLKATWPKVKKKSSSIFQTLRDQTSNTKNRRSLRLMLKQSLPPCVPYVGLYLSDLVFIEDGNRIFLSENVINFSKCAFCARVIQDALQYQQVPYHFVELPNFLNLLYLKLQDEGWCYQRSLELEPR